MTGEWPRVPARHTSLAGDRTRPPQPEPPSLAETPAVPAPVVSEVVLSADGRPPVLQVVDVTKRYGVGDATIRALDGVSATIEHGDFVAIMGSSGSGKSTLMHILGCLDIPTSGRYFLDGIDVSRLNENQLSLVRNRRIGFVFQAFNLIPRTPAIANVELPLVYGGVRRAERRRRAAAALELVGLSGRINNKPSQLSGGQQQRVAVARALVTRPSLLLADEPTGNLDSTATAEVLAVFERLNAAGRTVVIITHEPDVAEHAKRVIRLVDGKIVEDRRQGEVNAPPPLYDPDRHREILPS